MKEKTRPAVAVTGATGLVGSCLCDYFRRKGWAVRALARRVDAYPFEREGVKFFRCVLPEDIEDGAFAGVDVVFHAAYMTVFRGVNYGKRVNEEGTRRVLDEARSAGVSKFVFVSSMSAQPAALSYYGRSKYELEQILDPARDLILRPGLVLASSGGLFCKMRDEVARGRFFPVFDGGRQIVQTVHIDDLCEAAFRAVERGITGVVSVAEPKGVEMRELVGEIAKCLGRNPKFISLPHKPVVALLKAAEAVGLRLPISSENVLGLVALKYADTTGDLAKLGMSVRNAYETLDALFPR
jgi:NADH dehydrogenase